MGCIYEDFSGRCQQFMYDDNIETLGCDSVGNCTCSEDQNPNIMCETYESDHICSECQDDFNIDEYD